jgi:hypothetical protein
MVATKTGGKVHKLKRKQSADDDNGAGDNGKPKLDGKEVLTDGEPEQQELEGMEVPRNPKLELKAKEIAKRETLKKKLTKEIDELKDEAVLIMRDFEIEHYHKYGVHLDIESEAKLKVSVD